MAGRLEDEEYWHASEAKAFNFEDDEFGSQLCGVSKSGTARLSQRVREGMGGGDNACFSTDSLSGCLSRATISDSPQTAARPLQTLISEKDLMCILEAGNYLDKQPKGRPPNPDEELRMLRRQVEDRWIAPPVCQTINKMLLGHPYSLELYGSVVSSANTKKSLVYQLLRARPEAVGQYCQYLSTRLQLHELTDLLEMLGDSREASMKQFQIGVCGTVNPQRRLQKLKACLNNHFSSPESKDRLLIENYIKLLEWQLTMAGNDAEIARRLVAQPVLSSLAYTCQHHWGEPRGNQNSPLTFSQQQGISDRQYQWTVLNVRASLHSWEDIEGLFVTKNWLGAKRLKAAVPMDQVVMQLHAHGAPMDVLVKYLELIDNVEKRIALAKKLQCHKAVVGVFVAKRDRQALISYKASLHPQSEDYFFAENALRATEPEIEQDCKCGNGITVLPTAPPPTPTHRHHIKRRSVSTPNIAHLGHVLNRQLSEESLSKYKQAGVELRWTTSNLLCSRQTETSYASEQIVTLLNDFDFLMF